VLAALPCGIEPSGGISEWVGIRRAGHVASPVERWLTGL
jgi:hypothetical protein